ncbi:MAG: hydroxyacid dehydrogenase [Actinobacteria bacterium]|nr:hydroxyacid dehydrogenase [Actinomycetota bacterium]
MAEHLQAAPALKVLARYGVGVDAVDLDAAAAGGVVVTNTPGANSEAVAEHTIALLMAALRSVAAGDAMVRRGDWSVIRGRQLSGSVVGVVGFGRVGRGTARQCAALGCDVLVHDPYLPEREIAEDGHTPVPLQRLRTACDVVALHAPGGAVLIDAAWLEDCRPSQLVVNTARADLVDEGAVAMALREGRLFGYAADSLQTEADQDGTSPLLAPDLRAQVTVTPHLGGQTTQAIDRMGEAAVADVLAVLSGRPAHHPVDLPVTARGKES